MTEELNINGKDHNSNGYLTREQWFSLPLETRRRWWKDTNFDRKNPSEQLLEEVRSLLKANSEPGS